VSIFGRMPNTDAIECLAATGLARPDGTIIAQESLWEATYRDGEGRTGQCFRDGVPRLEGAARLPGEGEARFLDVAVQRARDGQALHVVREGPTMLYPIPKPNDEKLPLGVIRCSHPTAPVDGRNLRSFSPIELRTVGFIARQLVPMLQHFANLMHREQTIAQVRHDLVAPLNMIRDVVDTIAEGARAGHPPRDYDLHDLDLSLFFARSLVGHLDYDLETRHGGINPTPTWLEGDIVARVKNMLSRYADVENDMRIHFENIRVVPKLAIDRTLIERALCNLLINAIKYGARRSTIRVEARDIGSAYAVDVVNDGIGIEADEVPHLFKMYYRSALAKRLRTGMGLGLAIAKQAMVAHGGDLRLTSRKDPTVFSMIFPKRLVC
jgi:signal transduction histidine kinase